MKKLLFFLFTIILFTSCNNDSEDVTPTDNKVYKVTFKVSNFEINTTPLKDAISSKKSEVVSNGNYRFYYIYEKESGKAVKGNLVESTADQITEELIAGNYIIAITSYPYAGMDGGTIWLQNSDGSFKLEGHNFYTDYIKSPGWILGNMGNRYLYYEKVGFTVDANNTNLVMDVALKPMWSEVTVEVTDADVCSLPEGTTMITCLIDPLYYGISVADGFPTQHVATPRYWNELSNTSIATFREKGIITNRHATAVKDATVKLVFVKQTEEGDTALGERIIYKGNIEGGKRITFKGELGQTLSTGTFNISLANLEDGGIIPFN